ncbi:MAG: hypothetical protein D6705_04780, partial [Deltaproteobacteria bacterium]
MYRERHRDFLRKHGCDEWWPFRDVDEQHCDVEHDRLLHRHRHGWKLRVGRRIGVDGRDLGDGWNVGILLGNDGDGRRRDRNFGTEHGGRQ